MDDSRQALEIPCSDSDPQDLPRVHCAVGSPQPKPGGSLPHPIEAARRSAATPRRALPSKGARSYARPTRV